jgi:hypothetical protein
MSELKPPSHIRPGLRPARYRTAMVRRSASSPTSIVLNSSSAKTASPNHLFAANPAAQSTISRVIKFCVIKSRDIKFSDIKQPCPDRLPIILLGPINIVCPQLGFWNIALPLAIPSPSIRTSRSPERHRL